MRKLSIVLTVLLSVLLAFVACDNSIDIGLDTKVEVKEIRLNETKLEIRTGDEKTLVATVLPEDATDKSVTWSSSDEDVATVDANGKVTGIGAGEATITVTSNSDNTVYETCSVKVAVNPYKTPLTLEFKNAGKISVEYHNYNPAPVKISINGDSLVELDEEEVSVDAGDVIRFYRDVVGAKAAPPTFTIICKDSDCFVYGNAMSVLYGDQFVGKTEVPSYAFYELFSNNMHIINHDEIDLVLPATTLGNYCYAFMFDGCTSLTRAPELPATELAEYCYENMFRNCASLTTAPDLPAETLAESCYMNMFSECTGLTEAPDLPAETLAESCYVNMFCECTGLTEAPDLPATTLAHGCYGYMFSGCIGLTRAPELPAETLAYFCYIGMFQGCSSLNSITCLATDIDATGCISGWMDNAGSSATGSKNFYKNPNATCWTVGTNVPEGWTITDYNPPTT